MSNVAKILLRNSTASLVSSVLYRNDNKDSEIKRKDKEIMEGKKKKNHSQRFDNSADRNRTLNYRHGAYKT